MPLDSSKELSMWKICYSHCELYFSNFKPFFLIIYISRNYEHSSNHNFSWFYSILLIFGVRNLCMFLRAMNYNHLSWCNLCCLRAQNWILNSVYFECQYVYCNNFVSISLIRMPLVHCIKKNM